MKNAVALPILVAAMLLCVALTAEAAAAGENSPDRNSGGASVVLFGPGRSISPTAARAWLCRRKKHCH